ncbi:aryl-alcohol dehydrogenase AAD14 [Sclerotinia borealis F-4128]|uniref:Aryl-alcohol dehydrogenase AAD14 n=1 Tax=Sclerotinia borealis (strain F-4128) TaxID=1432307 RepID=W9CES9_SCLBF|nr:aryl-alcohol dehydrogenase AAD14 [Sclerotinia borealis F-4128]
MSQWPVAPEPPTEPGRFRVLSSAGGIRVSPLQLGAMSIGEAWSSFMGSMDKKASFKLLDAYFEAGGNSIHTANNYQNEQSEAWIGEWMAARKNRDQIVLATKFTTDYKYWELGKILYLGISDSPAWVASAANYYVKGSGKTPFSVYQGRWNVLLRDFERDIIPIAQHFGIALALWDVLGGGKFQTKKQIDERKKKGESLRSMFGSEQSEDEAMMSAALEKVAAEQGTESITAIAFAYVMAKAPNVFPLVGVRKIEHLQDNISALKIRLTKEQIESLESVRPFHVGFPNDFIGEDPKLSGKTGGLLAASSPMAFVVASKPIGYEGA